MVIESSTLTPTWIAALGAQLPRLVDAPVAGARARAEAEQLIFKVRGALGLIERVKPVWLLLDGAVRHLGPPGSGAWLKLVVHALFATPIGAMAELIALMRRAGLHPLNALLALRTMPVLSPAAAGTAGLMLAGNSMPRKPLST